MWRTGTVTNLQAGQASEQLHEGGEINALGRFTVDMRHAREAEKPADKLEPLDRSFKEPKPGLRTACRAMCFELYSRPSSLAAMEVVYIAIVACYALGYRST